MTRKKYAKYRQRLKNLTMRVCADVSSVAEQARGASGGQAAGELSNAPMHLGDKGTDEFMQDLNATLVENGAFLAQEAAAALRRLDDGTFGTCESCEAPIPDERLDAIPYARFCVQCAENAHTTPRVNLNIGRPQRPADTLAPEGEMGEGRGRRASSPFAEWGPRTGPAGAPDDAHASGTAGGGTALGGLAGTNVGHGDPDVAPLEDAMGSGHFDLTEARDSTSHVPRSGRSGGAVGGTPAGKRSGKAEP
jgi:RNA polymerase-binding transcription factor DksA